MTSFAPGTPKKVMKKVEKQLNKAQDKAQIKAMDKMLAGKTKMGSMGRQNIPGSPFTASPGTSPLDGLKNLPKMTGPLGSVGTPPAGGPNYGSMGRPNFKPSSTNTTTTDDMMGRRNPTAGLGGVKGLGGIGAALGKKMGMKKGGSVSSASKRADGCAVKGKTKGKMI
jgi:hypothetical protein